jgi:(S)-2-hydroxyglutarate dehydrogenase
VSTAAPERCDVAVVGGGIIGVAVARELALRHSRATVCLLEREAELASHQSSHNSGVIHSGIYYEPGSLKARLCVQGARLMYEHCERNGIANERCGKLIVATDPRELPRLDELLRRAQANGVPGVRRLDGEQQIRELEPHARGIAALHSPTTGITDFAAVTRSLAAELEATGATIATGCEVRRAQPLRGALLLEHSHGSTHARAAIFCAGLWADRAAVATGADPDPRIVPFRGAYLRLRGERRALVRSLIYPVPDPALPFLGVHLTRRTDGEVLIGPTALPVGARDAYTLATVRRRDLLDTLGWPGTWRMAARWWRTGATELRHAISRAALVRAAARFLPELSVADVEPAFAGVRAQALGRDGRLVDDFVFSLSERALHVRNAPSPAATSALMIARYVADEAQRTLSPLT